MTEGPLARYEALLEAGEIAADPAQREAIQHLDRVYSELNSAPVRTQKSGLFGRMFGGDQPVHKVKGLYFWGGVGRGKTFLMDVFFESLPFEKKQRMHFHRFMRFVHQKLKVHQGEADPLKKVAADLANQARVLCFDEFFVSDITDAMILAGLLDALFDRGVTLIATSNVVPDNLYKDGLQRSKFLPAIALLKEYTHVLNVDGGVDYRLRVLESAEIYHYPLDDSADAGLAASFSSLSPDQGEDDITLDVEGRPIRARKCGDGVVWFDFPAICEGPRSQNDYIELAMTYQTVLISNVPVFTSKKEDAARRFISLVDEFYDHNVKLIMSAEASILELYAGDRLVFEFERTASRLQEMQSREYLSAEHLP